MQEIVIRLLRVVARTAGASVALVARTTDEDPVASYGCTRATARALLSARRTVSDGPASTFECVPIRLADGHPAEVIVASPAAGFDRTLLTTLASEIAVTCAPDDGGFRADAIDRLGECADQLGEAIAILATPCEDDESTRVLHVNAGFTALLGYEKDEIDGHPTEILEGPLTDRDRMTWIRSRVLAREPARAVVVLYAKDRTPIWTELASFPAEGPPGVVHHVATFRDVTARRQFEERLSSEKRKLQITLASIADAVITVLADGRVEFVNAAAQRLLGVDLIEVYGANVGEVLRLVDDDGVPIDIAVRGDDLDGVRRGDAHLGTRSGIIEVSYTSSRIDSDDEGTVIVLRDVTVENRLATRLSFEASHDSLTGLKNRRAFNERLEQAVRGARERGEHHAVGFLDLDRFKMINDRFGHATGDRLLREIGRVIGNVVRNCDVAARIGGDEFGVLLANCHIDDARLVAETIRTSVEACRIERDGFALGVGVSVGLASIDADSPGASAALAAADAACYRAKTAGRNAIAG